MRESAARSHHLLFSFHGIPHRYLAAGDPYHCQCHKTARLVAAQLELSEDEWSVSFQSQVGREEWLRPYTDERLMQFATAGRQARNRRMSRLCDGLPRDAGRNRVAQSCDVSRNTAAKTLTTCPRSMRATRMRLSSPI